VFGLVAFVLNFIPNVRACVRACLGLLRGFYWHGDVGDLCGQTRHQVASFDAFLITVLSELSW
jgi:hypothetical protein